MEELRVKSKSYGARDPAIRHQNVECIGHQDWQHIGLQFERTVNKRRQAVWI
jgi:hypothetical protein